MAKKEEKAKTVLERVYNVPLRKEFQKAASWRRTKKAVKALREFIAQHMKSENVIIGRYANQFLWKNGIKNPPHHVKVTAVRDDKGKVTVELAELSAKAKRELEKEEGLKKKKEEVFSQPKYQPTETEMRKAVLAMYPEQRKMTDARQKISKK